MSVRIEVEGFHVTVRDFRALDDTAMLVSTWARNVARRGNRDAKTPPSAEEANVKKFASEMLKRAARIKVLVLEEDDNTILGFAVYPWSDNEAFAFRWVNAKLGDKRPFFTALGAKDAN